MPKQDNIIKGMVAGILAFFMLAVMSAFAKVLSDTHHVIELAFYRNLIGILPFLFIIFILNKRDFLKINKNKKLIIARSAFGTVSLSVTFGAFAVMPMADVTAFLFTSSLIVPIIGFLVLKEKVGIYRSAAIVIGFIGVLIMLKPGSDINTLGVTLALTAALMHACLHTLLRHLGKTESPETVTFYFVTIGTVTAALALPWVARIPTIDEIPLLIGLGLSGTLAQFLLSMAYTNAPAAIITVFNYSGIIWATFLGWIIWQDWPAESIWIGGTIVIASNMFMIWRESKKGKITEARVRAKF